MPQYGLYEGPRRSKMGSKTAKEGPRGPETAQERSKLSQDGLRTIQEAPKTPQDASKRTPKRARGDKHADEARVDKEYN